MTEPILSKIICYNQLVKELDELYQFYAKKSGLSETAFWIMYCVNEKQEPYTQAELCEEWSYSRQTINSALKNLENQGLLELIPLPENRKNKQIFLTPSGEDLVRQTVVPLTAAEVRAFAQLGVKDTDEYLRLTRRHIDLLRCEINKILTLSSEDA